MQQAAIWKWKRQSRIDGNYGNANQWTVNAGLMSLARESTQNSSDARIEDEPVELVYSLIRLTGARRRAFLAAAGWPELGPHLKAMGDEASGAVAAGQLRAGLEAFESPAPHVLLRIADYGCRGLTGPEFTDDDILSTDFGNFIKLCRLDLFSGKEEAAGGSFGLGKAVYWRFSRLQTVLFNSVVADEDAVQGRTQNRVFGVNQGVRHRHAGKGYEGRGYFGLLDSSGDVASVWEDQDLVDSLHLTREDRRPGTTALLIGFYDPDRPDLGQNKDGLTEIAQELRAGIEENFWPLIARGRLQVRVEVVDGDNVTTAQVAPEETYAELVQALRRFDAGDLDQELADPYSVVARDMPIKISRRKTGDRHESFTHTAKLVVTVSDKQRDTLENRVCLLRRPEMVVQTVDRSFEGVTYHAFLLAGVAIRPTTPSPEDVWADDFLRFAEPPSHDRWIPGKGRRQASQSSLTAHYVAPWVPNLAQIERAITEALIGLFGAPPPVSDRVPNSILRHLRFLRGGPGTGAKGAAPRKPEVDLTEGYVQDGHWRVKFEVRAKNRLEGWTLRPELALVGFDGTRHVIAWESPPELESGNGTVVDGTLRLESAPRGRLLRATVRGISTDALPLPAEESAVEIVVRHIGPLNPRPGKGVS